MNLPDWFAVAGTVLGVVGIVVAAIAVAFSRWRKATNAEREEYIAAIEDRNTLLEDTVERLTGDLAKAAEKYEQVQRDYHETQGQLKFMAQLVMGRCPNCEIDPDTGGCKHCALRLIYGQKPEQLRR